jgi:hypothetical protein
MTDAETPSETGTALRRLGGDRQLAENVAQMFFPDLTVATFAKLRVNEQNYVMKGSYSYSVRGALRTELLKLYWERSGIFAPVKVIKIENAAGETVQP